MNYITFNSFINLVQVTKLYLFIYLLWNYVKRRTYILYIAICFFFWFFTFIQNLFRNSYSTRLYSTLKYESDAIF